ncbi:hypothetical protein BH09BAC4_BH09BAC4_28180 [soil metagenome]
MFKLDTGTTLADLRALQEALQKVDDRRLTVAKATAQYAANDVRERIQLRGQNSAGETMLTSSVKKVGRYSESHGKVRQKEGLTTSIINLTFSGELLNGDSWTVIPDGEDGYGAGFREANMSERAGYMEDLFGDVFNMSPDEEQAAIDYFNDAISDIMNSTF